MLVAPERDSYGLWNIQLLVGTVLNLLLNPFKGGPLGPKMTNVKIFLGGMVCQLDNCLKCKPPPMSNKNYHATLKNVRERDFRACQNEPLIFWGATVLLKRDPFNAPPSTGSSPFTPGACMHCSKEASKVHLGAADPWISGLPMMLLYPWKSQPPFL